MTSNDLVAEHYSQSELGARIEQGFAAAGIDTDSITTTDLAMVDEFHTGGHPATVHLLEQLALAPSSSVLDIGCGIGGAARHCAQTFACSVTGIDLTEEYIQAAKRLSGWVGLDDQVTFEHLDATSLAFEPDSFDGAYQLHVGMNVADKAGLFASVSRVLRPSARFGVYDLMLTDADGSTELTLPLPWTSASATNHLATADDYQAALTAAGFDIVAVEDRTEHVLPTMLAAAEAARSATAPPPVGLHLLMGPEAGIKLGNMVAAMSAGLIAPTEIVAVLRH